MKYTIGHYFGKNLDGFDLLIGEIFVTHKLIMETNNLNHFKRISGTKLEDLATAYYLLFFIIAYLPLKF